MDDKHKVTKPEVESHLAAAIATTLKMSGHPVPQFTAALKIIKGVAGFDSLCGIEVTVDLEQRLGVELGENIFVGSKNGTPYARTFSQVVAAIWAILQHNGRT